MADPPHKNLRKQQRAFDEFRVQYNEERPHETLGQQPPARRYRPSTRSYPAKIQSPEYRDGALVRRVRSNGEIKWRGSQIGQLDSRSRRVLRTPIKVLPILVNLKVW